MHGPSARNALVLDAIFGLRRVFAELNRRLHDGSGGKISVADTLVLHHVMHCGEATPGEIGALTGLTSGAVTSLVSRLESAGLVNRHRDEEDGRVVRIKLAPGAAQSVMHVFHQAHADAAGLFSAIDDDALRQLAGLLGEIAARPDPK